MAYPVFSVPVIGLLLAGWLALPVDAQINRYVAPGGVDVTNTCIEVGNPCATLGYAIGQASESGGDVIQMAAGTYTEPGLEIDRSITLRGTGTVATILQAASSLELSSNRVVWVRSGCTAVVEQITIRHGQTRSGLAGDSAEGGAGENGAGLLINGAAYLWRCVISSNRTGNGGTGAAGFQGGRGGRGGGIYSDGYLELLECTVSDNQTGAGGAAGSGGIGGDGGDGPGIHNSSVLVMDRSTVSGNRAGAGGPGEVGGAGGDGGIWNNFALTIRSSTINGNRAGQGGEGTGGAGGNGGSGGGVLSEPGSVVTLAHSTVADNQAGAGGTGSPVGSPGSGGGLFASSGSVSMTHGLVASNRTDGVGPDMAGWWHSSGYNLVQTTNGWSVTGDSATVLTEVDPLLGLLTNHGGVTLTRRIPRSSPAAEAGDPAFAGVPALDQRGVNRVQGNRPDIGAYELENGILYVAEAGTDADNECRDALLPCGSLVHAVGQALAGDEIQMAAGVYDVSGVEVDRHLTLSGEEATNTILQAAASAEVAADRLLSILGGVSAVVQRVTLQHGHAADGVPGVDGENGGAMVNAGWLHVADCIIQSNRAGRGGDQPDPEGSGGMGGAGGAIYNQYASQLVIERSVLRFNQAGAGGSNEVNVGEGGSGGALASSGLLSLDQVEFDANQAGASPGGTGGKGGAFYISGGPAVVTRCSLVANRAGEGTEPGQGGGLFNEADLEVENTTFYANEAPGEGGALFNQGNLGLRYSTVVSNASGSDAGGLWNDAGQTLAISHSMLAGNVAAGTGPDAVGEWAGEGYVMVADTNGWNFAGGSDLTGVQLEVQPSFLPLGWYGGVTRSLPLAGGSPGQDEGDPDFVAPPATDQRGEPRVDGGRIDLGACESFNPDDDRDELPDTWEVGYGYDPFDPGITNVLAGPLGDPDEDGFDNLSEFIALTRPDMSNDYFQVSSVSSTQAVQIGFWSVTGRLYTLSYADTLLAPAWSNVTGAVEVPGTGGYRLLQDASAITQRHYSLQVRLAAP